MIAFIVVFYIVACVAVYFRVSLAGAIGTTDMKYSLRSLMIFSAVIPPLLAGIVWLWWSPWFWHVAEVLGVGLACYGLLWWFSSLGKSRWFP